MNPSHALRNWLHHLTLAVQAADAAVVAKHFARTRPLAVVGPRPQDRWHEWESWAAAVQQHLAPYAPGSIGVRFLGAPDIQVAGGEASLRWQVACRLPAQPPVALALDCEADLIEEAGLWVATRLHCRPLAPPQA